MLINIFNKNILFIIILLCFILLHLNLNMLLCDAPVLWQIDFNEVATPTMEGIVDFNNNLSFVICFIGILVGWLIINCCCCFIESKNSISYKFTHSNKLEIIWTTIPAIILLLLATPSFSLLYSMDEVADPIITLKIIGHQWYWSYEIGDYNQWFFCSKWKALESKVKYSCYLTDLDSMPDKQGYFRLLETNKRILLPTKTHIRLLISAADVIHSWTVPSFGVKIDACPGRLNQLNLFIKRAGIFFGQCSEICGVNHAFMPISVVGVEPKIYHMFLYEHFKV